MSEAQQTTERNGETRTAHDFEYGEEATPEKMIDLVHDAGVPDQVKEPEFYRQAVKYLESAAVQVAGPEEFTLTMWDADRMLDGFVAGFRAARCEVAA